MARGGINKAVVLKARQSLLAKGTHPSIDAVRVELGNTGSKTTIARYLKEIESYDPRPLSSRERMGEELSAMVESLLERVKNFRQWLKAFWIDSWRRVTSRSNSPDPSLVWSV